MAGTAIIILNEKNEVLLGKRLKEDGLNKYAAPGGSIEPDETDKDACVREAREETGLEVSRLTNLLTTHVEGKETHWFITREFSGTPENKEPTKCAGWNWYPLKEVPNNLWAGVAFALAMVE